MDPQVQEGVMERILYVLMGWTLTLIAILCLIAALLIFLPIYLIVEFVMFMEQVTKVRSKRALTEYID